MLADVDNRMRVAQEEIFGPVACLLPFGTKRKGCAANDVEYGGVVHLDPDVSKVLRLARNIEAGMVFVNTQNVRDLRQPFGGVKASGTGREGGEYSFEVFAEMKNVCISMGDHPIPKWGSDHGKISVSGKITHVPSMYLSELPGKTTAAASRPSTDIKISKRCRELGVDTIIVFDTHWLVNSAYHINCADHFSGVYTSNELPHFIRDMTYDYDGNPELGQLIADEAVKLGVRAKAHNIPSLKLEYGTLVPMRYERG